MSNNNNISHHLISQEAFDEAVLENQECFDLSQEEAVQETLSQYSHLSLTHILTSHPSSDCEKRLERNKFMDSIKTLQNDASVNNSDILDSLQVIQEQCKKSPETYLILLQQSNGMDALVSLFNITTDDVLTQVIQTLTTVLQPLSSFSTSLKQVQSTLRDSMENSMPRWSTLFRGSSNDNTTTNLQSLLLQLAIVSCRYSEANKKAWMHAATSNSRQEKNGIDALLQVLKPPLDDNTATNTTTTMVHACQLITTLCRFDDFRTPNTAAPVVSSANDSVLEFGRHSAVSILYNVALQATNNNDTKLLAASLSALRVLAIHDSLVQSMVAVGVLDLVETTLLHYNEQEQVITATCGLIRNLCANDAVKTTLCNTNTLQGIFSAMQLYTKNATLSQEVCGIVANMALRKPSNSLVIVKQHDGHMYNIQAMQVHMNNPSVERQACLALRNLASRASPESGIKEALLDAGAEQVLRQAGTTRASCVDEAYAALRDLGCDAKIIKYDRASGKAVNNTFGATKPNFRPVLEESSNNAPKHYNENGK